MSVLYGTQAEIGFGVDHFNPHGQRSIDVIGGDCKDTLKQRIIESCPRVPGVYGMLDRSGQLIYVGKSKSLRSRLLSYFSESNEDEKGGRIVEGARAIQWETQPSEFAALLREQQLIRLFSPRWNVQGVPKRQRPLYLCLGRDPAQFFLSRKPPETCIALHGPFYGAARMTVAVDALNQVFGLRDCGQKQTFQFAEQLLLFDSPQRPGCLRLEIGTCLGPCVAACTRNEYDARVAAASEFLDGRNTDPLARMRKRMEDASRNQQYELAGRALKTLKSLEYVHRKLTMLASARREYSFVYAVPGWDGCHIWYLIHCGELVDVAATPVGSDEYRMLRPTIQNWKAVLESDADYGNGPFAYTLGLVASWFRKHRGERERTFLPSQAGRKYRKRSMTAT
ncbi:MAG: GIY-YIG nuclease family protein [Planctomycetota bacterium]